MQTEESGQAEARQTEPTAVPAPRGLDARRFGVLLAALVFLTFPTVLLGLRTFVFRDYGLFSYPVAAYARESFWRGEVPLWNPLSNCGIPFLAQWNTMVLYPPALIYLLLPLPWSLSFFCLLHLFWGGLGMYCLAREWSGFKLAAGVAGIIFAFNGLSLNFLMWPSHTATFAWLPWVLWLGQSAWRTGGRKMVWAIAAASFQMLAGGPETILVTWALLGLLALVDAFGKTNLARWGNATGAGEVTDRSGHGASGGIPGSDATLSAAGRGRPALGRVLLRFAVMGVMVALVCAAQLLPFLQLVAHSQRDSGYGALARGWSMPIWGWANFLVPLFGTTAGPEGVHFQPGQYWTSSYYAGIGTVWLGLIALWRARGWRVRLLGVVVGFCLVLALGDVGLIYRGMREVAPALGMIRYPVKFVIPVLALAPLLAAEGMSIVVCKRHGVSKTEWILAVALVLAIAVVVVSGRLTSPGAWAVTWHNGLSRVFFLLLTVILLATFAKRTMSSAPGARYQIVLGLLLLLTFFCDLITQVPNQNPTASPTVYAPGLVRAQFHWNPGPVLGESRAMLAPAAQEALKYRSISDPGKNYLLDRVGLLADCNLLEAIPQVHGFFSLTPAEINDVTAAPYVQTNLDFSRLLDFIGVSDVIGEELQASPRPSAQPLITAGQQPIFANDRDTFSAFSRTNLDLRRIVFLQPSARGRVTELAQPTAKVLASHFSDQQVSFTVQTPGPALAVVAQTYYPAWKAYVDGALVPVWRANYAFQAVEVPAGKHQVELRYRDDWFLLGAVISAIGLLISLRLWVGSRRRGY